MQLLQRLGTAEGPGALPEVAPSSVMVDSRGRYWLLFYGQTLPLVFNPNGQLAAELGRRGRGPGEFQHPEIALALPGDSALVFDRLARTLTLFDNYLRPARSIRIEAGNVFDLEPAFWPTLWASAAFATPNRIGWPMHAYDASTDEARISQSFGLEESSIEGYRGMERLDQDLVASKTGATVWAVDKLRYRMSEWTADRELVRVFERRVTWFPALSDGSFGSHDKPPPPQISGAAIDEHGYLWVYILVAAPTWKAAWSQVPRFQGKGEVPASIGLPNSDLLYRTIVEIIDTNTGRLVANAYTTHRVVKVLPERGLVAAHNVDAHGRPTLSILKFTLTRN